MRGLTLALLSEFIKTDIYLISIVHLITQPF